ncbi:ankyrin repeat domain-containing protein [Gordonia sp. ABSL1-1]|uniref:ankyrin repeat domain-containing protein n=1 Tax=Gordonia sp. ABSL1-1 TaxID=3053923 RepID=UPI002573609C|nr:ankyrin repeat domain-containing protein [Gordonia sp. ABSL1-1]MDL9936736.1 ankyrin repeat domain-containing protein [Gordonia sp. ABSL1-1]
MLVDGDLATLTEVVDRVGLDAVDPSTGRTALGFVECPEDLVRWLVQAGADVAAPDRWGAPPIHRHAKANGQGQLATFVALGVDLDLRDGWGRTPLHEAARTLNVAGVRLLIDAGADVDVLDRFDTTPLRCAINSAENLTITRAAQISTMLIGAGASIFPEMAEVVTRVGARFEFGRAAIAPDRLSDCEAGLATLYRLFDVTPVEPRRIHDGQSPIEVPAGGWRQQFDALWHLLVPIDGPAATVQGEVIRICGKLSHEILDLSAMNWDSHFRDMADAVPGHLATGRITDATSAEVRRLVSSARRAGVETADVSTE